MIKIIAHRGYWIQKEEQNTLTAFARAIEYNYGIETDFRDLSGELVIAHDPPNGKPIRASSLGEVLKNTASSLLAINIKSDGIDSLISHFLKKYEIKNFFVFDMSIPEMRKYISKNLVTYGRLSELEIESPILERVSGIWLDMFDKLWFDTQFLAQIMEKYHNISIVSPELHGREHKEFWYFIKNNGIHLLDNISICTDFPKQAEDYFYA